MCAIALPWAMASAGSVGDGRGPAARSSAAADRGTGAGDHRGAGAGTEGHTDGGSDDRRTDADSGGSDGRGTDAKASAAEPSRSALALGLGLATAARCGPGLTSPDGVEAQTCVLTQGQDTWARTYYRNATGRALDAVLSFMGPRGRTVQMRCAVGADDEPGTCETHRERIQGEPAEYSAVAEFAHPGGAGPLLLRTGSNSAAGTGS
ncbi:hypothetical protein ACIHAR_23445 [Streptomyces sp. NPDC052016]|uniref:hypothetical protein n=1 Tax=Streptomyces sp. NPDC052016 TaxID=3365680 RepID=UPI0037D20046